MCDWWHCKNISVREEEEALSQKVSLSIVPIQKSVKWNRNAGGCWEAGPGLVAAAGAAELCRKLWMGVYGPTVPLLLGTFLGLVLSASFTGAQQCSSPCCIPLTPGLCWPQPNMLLGLGECRRCRSSSLQHPLGTWQRSRFCTG